MDMVEFIINSPHKGETFIIVIAAIICVQFLVKLWDWFVQRFEIETKASKREKMQIESIAKLEAEVQNIKLDQNEIKDAIQKLTSVMDNMQAKQDASDRARIKDRIGQAYRYYRDKQQWNSMEKEAFDELIASYEAAGGKNSFIHETCQPKSHEWKVVD